MAKYIKPTLQTKFHIDFNWWENKQQNFRSFLLAHTCENCKKLAEDAPKNQTIDWVDPETAQVFTIERLWHTVNTHCSQQPDYLSESLPLTTAVFRLFIANNNTPLTPVEIHQQLNKKDAKTILRTIGGHRIYKGIRPVTKLVSK